MFWDTDLIMRQLLSMSSHSIPEPQENALSAAVASANTSDTEMDSHALSLLREFFLLLDQWDRQAGQS
jgi:hypothetical protein